VGREPSVEPDDGPELTVLVPTYEEGENIGPLIDGIGRVLAGEGLPYEVLVVDAGSQDATRERAQARGARVIVQSRRGYGGALADGFDNARGKFILTMDSDLSHDPNFMSDLLARRHDADVVIASRYVPGGASRTSLYRKTLSWILNQTFRIVLSLPHRDLSSGFRLYNRRVLEEIEIEATDFDVLEEILIKAHCNGWRIVEAPFVYQPRAEGESHARLFKFALSYLKTLYSMWQLRNSVFSADYDERAFNSKIPLQRYWQRKRFEIITGFADRERLTLDVGCGSSRIMTSLPKAIGLDIQLKKLRYLRRASQRLVTGSMQHLPFRNCSFGQVVCSEVIEHIPEDRAVFESLAHVLEPGGILIIGTPDYSRASWRMLERLYSRILPRAYAEQHITHYTAKSLLGWLQKSGFRPIDCRYVGYSEIIVKAVKEAD